MKKTNLVIDVAPKYLGVDADEHNVESFAFDVSKNVEKAFNIKCDFSTKYENKNYEINSSDPFLEVMISEFIDNNWNHIFSN